MKSYRILAALLPCSLVYSVVALSPPVHQPRSVRTITSRAISFRSIPVRFARLPRLFLDPYEEQYRKYWGTATQDEQPAEQYVQQHQTQTPQRQQRFMPGGTQQNLQHLSSPQITSNDKSRYTANGYYESSTDDVEVTNLNPYTDYTDQSSVEDVNSYDLQYQQYLEEMKQQMMSESNEPTVSTETGSSSEFTMSSNEMTYEPQQQSTDPTTAELVAQQEQHTQDIEESFLRTLSNEVNYKKFLNQSPYSLTDINVPLIIQRILDNIEDGQQKRNGKLKGLNKRLKRDRPRDERKTVVVLGTGWAAHAFIKLASTYDLRIVVVSPVNHFVFTPMLASAAVGTVEYRSMTEPIRVTNPSIDNYVEGRAIGIDVEGK